MKNGIVIAGFAGVGKSVLANKYSNVVDLEIMKYKWEYEEEIFDLEQKKGTSKKTRKREWPQNYVQAIQKAITQYDIILISTDDEILDELDKEGIKYLLCFPTMECKEEYLRRFRNRGNTEEFVERVSDTFEVLINSLQNYKAKKLVLREGETLETILKRENLLERECSLKER